MTARKTKAKALAQRGTYDATPRSGGDTWMAKHGITLGHAIAPLDEIVRRMERRWGIGRLPGLVSPELAAKLGARIEEYERALAAEDLDAVLALVPRLMKGWQHLDQEATAAGHKPIEPLAWPIKVGAFPAVVCKDEDWQAVQDAHPDATVYMLSEIGRYIELATLQIAPGIAEAKRIFPAATVTEIRPRTRNPLPPVDYDNGGDELPF